MPDEIPRDAAKPTADPSKEQSIASLKEEIEKRLLPYCENWPREQFDAMIKQAAEIEWRHLHRHEVRWTDEAWP